MPSAPKPFSPPDESVFLEPTVMKSLVLQKMSYSSHQSSGSLQNQAGIRSPEDVLFLSICNLWFMYKQRQSQENGTGQESSYSAASRK